LLGYRAWPGIPLGAFLANATANTPLGTAAGIALGNTLEALLGAAAKPDELHLTRVVGVTIPVDLIEPWTLFLPSAAGSVHPPN